jgi:transposase
LSHYELFVGIDLGSRGHQVCVLGNDGARLRDGTVTHDEAGLRELLDWLRQLSGQDLSRVAVAIETPHGAVVDALVEAGAHVYHLNPKQLDRFRDRHSVAGAKDDRLDAFVLAASLRTDLAAYRRVHPEDPRILELREASRLERQLLEQQHAAACRLAGQLHRFWPQLLELVPGADELWLWALLKLAPRPQQARRLTRAKLVKLLRDHRIRRFDVARLMAVLDQPALSVAAGTVAAATGHMTILIEQLELLHRQHRDCTAWIARILAQLRDEESDPSEQPRQHRDAEILLSMPGVGKLVAATVLSEASRAVATRDYQLIRALSGVAPVTRASGKRRVVLMRRACNPRLRYALHHWSLNSLQRDPTSRTRYDGLRQRGLTVGHALRVLGDYHLRILIAMLRDGTTYVPRPPAVSCSEDEPTQQETKAA